MSKLSQSEIDSKLEQEGNSEQTFGASTSEVEHYLKSKQLRDENKKKNKQGIYYADEPVETIDLVSKRGKKYQGIVLRKDNINKIATVAVQTKDSTIKQYVDTSKESPKVLATSRRYWANFGDRNSIYYADGVFVMRNKNSSTFIMKLDKNRELKTVKKFDSSHSVYLFQDGLLEVSGGEDKNLIGIYQAKDDGLDLLMTFDKKYGRYPSISYDDREKVLSSSYDMDEGLEGASQEITEYYKFENNKLRYMGEQNEPLYEYEEENDDEYYNDDIPAVKFGNYEVYCQELNDKDSDGYYYSFVWAEDTRSGKKTDIGYINERDIIQTDGKNLLIERLKYGTVDTYSVTKDGITELSSSKMSNEEWFEKYLKYQPEEKTRYGTFYNSGTEAFTGCFVDNEKNIKILDFNNDYGRGYISGVTCNALVNVTNTISNFGQFEKQNRVVDLRDGSQINGLKEVAAVAQDFFAAKKDGEEKFSVYEASDTKMETPLFQADKIKYSADKNSKYIVYENDGMEYMVKNEEGKIRPVARLSNDGLALAYGKNWVKINLSKGVEAYLNNKNLTLAKPHSPYEYLDDKLMQKLAKSQLNNAEKEPIEFPKESFRNNKQKLLQKMFAKKQELSK